jgi:hypothetical protein
VRAMVAKEFRELRRDRRTVAMMIVLPVGIGVAVSRHILRIEPLATASTDEIAALATPAIEQYLQP